MERSSASGGSGNHRDLHELMRHADVAHRQGNFTQAISLCGQILAVDPQFLPARLLSAVVHFKVGHHETAESKFMDIIATHPRHFGALIWLARLYAGQTRFAEAAAVAERAAQADPNDTGALLQLSRALFELGRLPETEAALRQLLALKEDMAEAQGKLGTVLQQLGNLEEAALHLQRAIQLDPLIGPPYYDLVLCKKILPADQPLLDSFEETLKTQTLKPRDQARIEYALGKAYNDLGDYEKAIRHYDEANRIELDVMSKTGRAFNEAKSERGIQFSVESSSNMETMSPGSYSSAPILIVGMMRSGTTLVEQILSSHSAVGAGGELPFWVKVANDTLRANRWPNAEESKNLAKEYLDVLQLYSQGKPRITDKQPHNFVSLGLIASIFPNARIIHCRRNLVDTCLSIYMTPFRVGPEFGHSRENLTYFAKGYKRLMDLWRSVLPAEQFLKIRYEDLVDDPKRVVGEMLEFLGLPWEENCLHHELNPRQVTTPSLWQVRQPIYKASLARWKKYEPWLGVFRELMEEAP